MSKLLNSVLDRVSENNNEYRSILRALNSTIDEVTTSLVGDVVTLSSYTADFSNTLSESKEKLVNPISRIIESYVIKDLRSVETVNEQFVEKINDKLENADIKSKEEKDSFANSLNNLLNDKYLEIVKIKRIDFFNPAGVNENIEEAIDGFVSYLNGVATFNQESLNTLINDYKSKIYRQVKSALEKISNLDFAYIAIEEPKLYYVIIYYIVVFLYMIYKEAKTIKEQSHELQGYYKWYKK